MSRELPLRPAARLLILSVCLLGLSCAKLSIADDPASLETRELRTALKALQAEASLQRERLVESEDQRKALALSLSEAVRVSEEQVAIAHIAQLKLQALGVDVVSREENAIEQRLLKAVRDLDIAQQELDRKNSALRELSEAYLKTLGAIQSLDAAERGEAERALALANAALQPKIESEGKISDLEGSRVVSLDSKIGLVVLDAGRATGVRVGTPVRILRGDRTIYTAVIVDVRDGISGAVLQDRLTNEEVEIGDQIRLLPEKQQL